LQRGEGRIVKNQNIKGSEHQKFFKVDKNIESKKKSQHGKITTLKDKNVESDLPMALGLLNLT
jgi:hypothetical protein